MSMKDIDMVKDSFFIPVQDMIDRIESEGGKIRLRDETKLEYEWDGILSRSMVSKDGLVDSFHFQVRVDRKKL